MKLVAYTHVLGQPKGRRIGKVVFYETGYYSSYYDDINFSPAQVDTEVKKLNDQMGIPEDVAKSAAMGSMFGWHTPAAQEAIDFFKAESLKENHVTA